MRYGYERVSTTKGTQKFDRQEDPLTKAGCEKIISERVSGTAASKPVLEELLGELKEGDQLVVVSIDRLGRSTQQVLNVIERLKAKKVDFVSLKQNIDTTSSEGKFFLTIVAAFSELEVEMCRSRVRDGLEAAKRRGKKLGRPRKDMDTAIKMWQSRDYSISEICSAVGCAKQTLYNEIKRRGVTRE